MFDTILLDIDGTLINTIESGKRLADPFEGHVSPENIIEYSYGDNSGYDYCALRNGLDKFFDGLKALNIQIVIFSAGQSEYINKIAEIFIKKYNITIFKILTRSDCTIERYQNSDHIRNIYKYKAEFDKPSTILIDDRIEAGDLYKYAKHYSIRPFVINNITTYNEDNDLDQILDFLMITNK